MKLAKALVFCPAGFYGETQYYYSSAKSALRDPVCYIESPVVGWNEDSRKAIVIKWPFGTVIEVEE